VFLEQQALLEHRDLKEALDLLDHQVPQAHQALLVMLAQQDQMELQVNKEQQEHLVLQGIQVRLDLLVLRDHREL